MPTISYTNNGVFSVTHMPNELLGMGNIQPPPRNGVYELETDWEIGLTQSNVLTANLDGASWRDGTEIPKETFPSGLVSSIRAWVVSKVQNNGSGISYFDRGPDGSIWLSALKDKAVTLSHRICNPNAYADSERRADANARRTEDSMELARIFKTIDACCVQRNTDTFPMSWRPRRRVTVATPTSVEHIRTLAVQTKNACRGLRGTIYEQVIREADIVIHQLRDGSIRSS